MVDTIKFSEMTDGGDIDNDKKTPGLKTGENVLFNNPWTFLPPGTTAQRPAPAVTMYYRLRFNTSDQLYEYYDAILTAWTQLQESLFTQGPFITYTADASLPDAQNLGVLANGILKQTISLGIATLNIAIPGTDYWAPGDALTRTQAPTVGNDVTNKTYVDSLIAATVSSVQGTESQILVNGSFAAPVTGALILTLPANIITNNYIPGYATTVTAAGNTVLTVASAYQQFFTGSTTQTVTMPVVSTLSLGFPFQIINNSSGVVTVQSSGGNTIQVMAAGTALYLTCIAITGTTDTSWDAQYAFDGGSGNVSAGLINQIAFYAANGNTVSGLTTANTATLQTNASGVPSFVAGIPIKSVNTQTITATGAFSYTPTAGCVAAIFELQAGGGGSSGTTGAGGQTAAGGAGGGGAYMRLLVTGTANLAAITGSVGIAGTAGTSGNNAGGTGGSTTLVINAGTTWTAAGGSGGSGQTSSATAQASGVAGTGGNNTTGTNGTLIANIPGQSAGIGFSNGVITTVAQGPAGGSSQLGRGGPINTGNNGSTGVNYGGGAGGSLNGSGANQTGSAGAQGIVIVTEFCTA